MFKAERICGGAGAVSTAEKIKCVYINRMHGGTPRLRREGVGAMHYEVMIQNEMNLYLLPYHHTTCVRCYHLTKSHF